MKITLMFAHLTATLTATFAALGLVTALAQAQPATEGQPGRPRRAEPPRDERAPAFPPGPGAPDAGILNEEQRDKLREAMEAGRDDMQRLEEKMRKARRELEDAIYAKDFSEKTLREKSAAIAEIETERVLFRAKMIDPVRSELTAEQLERWKRAQQQRMERAERPGLPRDNFPRGEGRPLRGDDREPGDRPPLRPRADEGERPRDAFRDEAPRGPRRLAPPPPGDREFQPEPRPNGALPPSRPPRAPSEDLQDVPPAGR